jgi:hypothetical protein
VNWEALDEPALVLPRVMDVHGTLLRLGFTGQSQQGNDFYWQFVPLFGGGIPAQFHARRISHVRLALSPNDAFNHVNLNASYGYPERYRKKNKIIIDFKRLSNHTSHRSLLLHDDRDLRSVEKLLLKLIDCIQNRVLVCTMQVDTADGVDIKHLEPHEAIVYAVEQEIECDFSRTSDDDVWWIPPPTPDPPPIECTPVNKYSRLPNFDRRRDVLRHVRRPV